LDRGLWQHPGDDAVWAALPWFEDPLDFLASTESMTAESRSLDQYADDERSSQFFHVVRESTTGPAGLPLLDAELAVLIAINRNAGDDVVIALDYRPSLGPVVAVSDVWTDPSTHIWRPVAPSFDIFAAALGIRPD
jgi:hypothetical protein